MWGPDCEGCGGQEGESAVRRCRSESRVVETGNRLRVSRERGKGDGKGNKKRTADRREFLSGPR